MTGKPTRVLFVCMGNICRSPSFEAVLRARLATDAPELAVRVDSAGTHDYHVGDPPDARSVAAARHRGIDMSTLRARQLEAADFRRFDYVLVMDERNLADATAMAPDAHAAAFGLALDYAPALGRRVVPDPYYGGEAGFEDVLDLAEAVAAGLINHWRGRSPAGSR